MLFSERYFLVKALEKKADMNRVQDLFKARDAIKAYKLADEIPPVVFCYICEFDMDYCHHSRCCQDSMDDHYNLYCPRCGEFIRDDDDNY